MPVKTEYDNLMQRRFFSLVPIAFIIAVFLLVLTTPSSASAATKTWHTLVTGVSGETQTTTQIYGYTKDTSFGEIVIECDEETGEDTGFAFLNSRIGEKEVIIEDREESYLDWENPRALNFLECQILAPNIPSSVDYDWEYHWEHPEEIMHYKPGPPIWPGNPSWAILAPSVPNNMLVVVKATNPNPYPVSAIIGGHVNVSNDLGIFFPLEDPVLEFAPGETRYLKVSDDATQFITEYNSPLSGTSGYSSAAWQTNSYQILAEDYPPSWIINGSTTVDVPPYGRLNGMYFRIPHWLAFFHR